MPSRPFTRAQALENARFLDALRQTGNARLAARELGVHRSTFTKRRANSAAFAQGWDAALAAAHARFRLSGGERSPERLPGRGTGCKPVEGAPAPALKTQGGEPAIVRTASGRLQLRLAPPGRMTKAAEQAFFRALSASANVRLSAAAAGFAHSSFYARRRKHRAFEEEMKVALSIGWDRLMLAGMAAAEAVLDGSGEDCAWRHLIGETPLPPMSVEQIIHLLTLHRDAPRSGAWNGHAARPRPFEETAAHLIAIIDAIKRRTRREETGDWRFEGEPAPPPELPPLHLVTGWSKASGKPPHNPNEALFGGWRLDDWKKRKAGKP